MKNLNLFTNLTCILPALLLLCIVNLKAQNELNGYTYLGFNSYGPYNFYYLSDCEASWEEANEAAIEMGGFLATITYESENLWLTYGLEASGVYEAWIGLRGENGIYEWANGETDCFCNWGVNPYPVQEPIYADGAALIRAQYGFWNDNYFFSYPVSGEFRYIVEFTNQPNCSNNPNKTYVCHNGNTICVNATALQSHLDHGDLEGPCGPCNTNEMQIMPDETLATDGHAHHTVDNVNSDSNTEFDIVHKIATSDQINVFPNPASEEINVLLPQVNQEATLRILSPTGQEIHFHHLSGQQSITLDISSYSQGIYMIDVRSVNGHYQKKFVKL